MHIMPPRLSLLDILCKRMPASTMRPPRCRRHLHEGPKSTRILAEFVLAQHSSDLPQPRMPPSTFHSAKSGPSAPAAARDAKDAVQQQYTDVSERLLPSTMS
ncbi:hypothetical protein E2C01_071727 [Portunus trituberculatus]|uniref:Uncharacterized protein n=1 Tax=Portunus trituberculatus TaxID=210409 RepID=A0A5B7I5T8_PORTR|nr:hypothetical protein [Portunus trituberculatus]